MKCEVCTLERNCATCAMSMWECKTTHFCQDMECAVAEDYSCPEWEPLVIYPYSYMGVFGCLHEDQPN